MKIRKFLIILTFLLTYSLGFSQEIQAFSLYDADSNQVSLTKYLSKKAIVIIFHSNHCVYSKKYEDRIIDLNKKFSTKNIQFILINSNLHEHNHVENMEGMKKRAEDKNFQFPYLKDETQEIAKKFGATKTPEVFILTPKSNSFSIIYNGNIDNNPLMPDHASEKYLDDILNAIAEGNTNKFENNTPKGCNILMK